jgi:hypothetical protein
MIAFNVFHSTQGSQGLLGKPSNQQLETVFGSHKDVDVVTKILKEGREQKGDLASTGTGTFSNLNVSRGSADAH